MSPQAKPQAVASGNNNIHNLQALRLAREPHDWRKRLLASDLPAGTKVAGFAIAEWFINRASGYCFAGHQTMADKCGMTRRGIQDAIRRLVEAGFLRVEKRGFQQTNRTYLALPQMHVGALADARGDVHQMHVVTCTEPMTEPTSKNNLTASTESVTSREDDAGFRRKCDEEAESKAPTSQITDTPIRRGSDEHAQRCFIGTAAVKILGHIQCPKVPDGRYLDRAIIESIPADVLESMIQKGRKGRLMLSDVAAVLAWLPLAQSYQQAA